jgi:hypothetical protein
MSRRGAMIDIFCANRQGMIRDAVRRFSDRGPFAAGGPVAKKA